MKQKRLTALSEMPTAGCITADLITQLHKEWVEAAKLSGANVEAFDPNSPLSARLKWAEDNDWLIGGALSRFSTKLQCSTSAQLLECVRYAARHKMYIAPELCCVDEGVSGRKVRRDGLERMKRILGAKLIDVLLVYKVSRILRSAHKSVAFVKEDVVEEGLHAVSVSQGIDTRDEATWKVLLYVHGVLDEIALTTIADHVFTGLANLFREGWTTGALPVGYRRKEVPGARPTKLGKPRTAPEVHPEHAALLNRHFELHRDGMSLQRGFQLWVAAGGPCDPRSVTGRMTYNAYRKMFRNQRYIGVWGFGRMKNVWKSKLDYNTQEPRPESEVMVVRCEELRIVSDELFFAVQAELDKRKLGSRGPHRQDRHTDLWDWIADNVICSACDERFYHYGCGGGTMRCKNGVLCPQMTSLRRKDTVLAVIAKLQDILLTDAEIIAAAILSAQALDNLPDENLDRAIAAAKSNIAAQSRKIQRLAQLLDTDSDEEATELKDAIGAARSRRSQLQAELAHLEGRLNRQRQPLTAAQVRAALGDLKKLLLDGASGKLGVDAVGKAVTLFKAMVGGRIVVHAEPRPGRKRPVVRATFTPRIGQAVADHLSAQPPTEQTQGEVELWLRPPPACDRLAVRVHELVDDAGLSFGEAADIVSAEVGRTLTAVRVSFLYSRYYQMIGQRRPRHGYNHGRPRKPPKNAA